MNNTCEEYNKDMKFLYYYFSSPKMTMLFVAPLSSTYWNMCKRENQDWGGILDDLPRIKRLYE